MVISAVTILVTGVTFAALQSQQAVLAGNSIQTATADLKISTTGNTFANSQTGFAFSEVVPGTTTAASNAFYLKNTGTLRLSLKVAISSVPANPDDVDLSKTYLVLTRTDTNTTQKLSLSELAAAYGGGGVVVTDALQSGQTAQYRLQAVMDTDAFTGQQADIGGIDIVFSGVAVTD
jgi:hypothetical protein